MNIWAAKAGFDCRAYRLRYLDGTTIFEVDHPDTLAWKMAKLREALPKLPDNVRYVKIDFNQGRLPEELIRADFQRSRPAVFLWEGVTNYLTVAAVDAVLHLSLSADSQESCAHSGSLRPLSLGGPESREILGLSCLACRKVPA
jgi:methyltransferase (TIGR00027 family)